MTTITIWDLLNIAEYLDNDTLKIVGELHPTIFQAPYVEELYKRKVANEIPINIRKLKLKDVKWQDFYKILPDIIKFLNKMLPPKYESIEDIIDYIREYIPRVDETYLDNEVDILFQDYMYNSSISSLLILCAKMLTFFHIYPNDVSIDQTLFNFELCKYYSELDPPILFQSSARYQTLWDVWFDMEETAAEFINEDGTKTPGYDYSQMNKIVMYLMDKFPEKYRFDLYEEQDALFEHLAYLENEPLFDYLQMHKYPQVATNSGF